MGGAVSKSSALAYNATQATTTNTNQQAQDLEAQNFNLSDLKVSSLTGDVGLEITTTDMNAINRAFDAVQNSTDKSFGALMALSTEAMGIQREMLAKGLTASYEQTKDAIALTAEQTGNNWQNKMIILVTVLAVAWVASRGKARA